MIRARIGLGVVLVVIAVPVVAVLIGQEAELEPPAAVEQELLLGRAVVQTLSYTEGARPSNLGVTLGLPADLASSALTEARRASLVRSDIERKLTDVSRVEVRASLCPGDIPVMYRAARLLLADSPTGTAVVEPWVDGGLKPWKGYNEADIETLFKAREQRVERAPDDTAIALLSIVLGKAGEAARRVEPWQRTADEGGRVVTLLGQFPDGGPLLMRYTAYAHVLAEIVQADVGRWGCVEAPAKPAGAPR